MTAADRLVAHAICLGCGCTCDDIDLLIRGNRIVDARHACPLGAAWFGDGTASARALVAGNETTVDQALDAAAGALAAARQPLVYLAPDLTCEAQREGVAVADIVRGAVDSVTSATALSSLLASQERGRASATLGEVRNRADLLLCWGVDPAERYPRYWSRYSPEPPGVHVPDGRRSRTVIAVHVGDARGPADADHHVVIRAEEEVATLAHLRSLVQDAAEPIDAPAPAAPVEALASMLLRARYAVIVADAEPRTPGEPRDRWGIDGLVALAEDLNAGTRCALSVLRAGGNRSGADAVLTWQTGYPAAVDFSRGVPRYRPFDGAAGARLARGETDVVLVLGAADRIPEAIAAAMTRVPLVLIGPHASAHAARAHVALDTSVPGIHERGMVLRMDDIPLEVEAVLPGPPATAAIARDLRERIVALRHRGAAS